jgi:hypothetical protein
MANSFARQMVTVFLRRKKHPPHGFLISVSGWTPGRMGSQQDQLIRPATIGLSDLCNRAAQA